MYGPNYTILLFPGGKVQSCGIFIGDWRQRSESPFEDDKNLRSTLFGCLAKGLEYIHESGVCHKDVEPESILDLEGQTVCHVNFGISVDFWGLTSRVLYSIPVFVEVRWYAKAGRAMCILKQSGLTEPFFAVLIT